MTDLPAPIGQPDSAGATAGARPPDALRGALVEAIGRRRRRLRFRAAIAAATCAAVAAAVLGGGVLTSGPERVLAIDDDNGEWVKVSILDGQAGAEEMTSELQDAGIDGEVQRVPAVPQFVGHWMGIAQVDPPPPPPCDLPQDAPPGLICVAPPLLAGDDAGFHGDLFQIRRDAIDKLAETRTIFYVGREPEPGEKPLDFPPTDYDVRVAPVGGEPSEGSGSWAQSLGPGRRPSP
jgi:hypothetical protein